MSTGTIDLTHQSWHIHLVRCVPGCLARLAVMPPAACCARVCRAARWTTMMATWTATMRAATGRPTSEPPVPPAAGLWLVWMLCPNGQGWLSSCRGPSPPLACFVACATLSLHPPLSVYCFLACSFCSLLLHVPPCISPSDSNSLLAPTPPPCTNLTSLHCTSGSRASV